MIDNSDEKGIHDGHRRRMKDKLITHGARIFDSYELLEMLLYYSIPYKDTNPISKRLLARFGSLDGVFSATREELLAVNGIGERTADLILTVGDMLIEGELSRLNQAEFVFDNYAATGGYLVDYFNTHEGLTVSALMLDGRMTMLGRLDIYDINLSSAGIRSKAFIDEALLSGATVIILASSRRHSPLFLSEGDRATVKMLTNDLAAVGVRIAEHYIVGEDGFIAFGESISVRLKSDSDELNRFFASREGSMIE